MLNHPHRFNGNLLVTLAVALAVVCGCRTERSEREQALSTFRVFLGVNQDAAKRSQPVPVYRDHPVTVNVESEPFLTEANVMEARVVDVVGGFALSIRLDRQGSWLLEQYTAANQGRHLAIQTQFVSPEAPEHHLNRWLAAPLISGRISDGILLFTPDATHEEAEQIAVGLNNVAKKGKNTPDKQAFK
jgi:preprotein translocase subunit SecD